MKTVVSLITLACLIVVIHGIRHEHDEVQTSSEETWGVHKAQVDNFDSDNTDTYDQRYLSNLEFARDQDPPIIIYVGGEWEVKKGQLGDIGQLYHIAKENEGALYYLEHRFYGKSLPKADYSTENMKFLTSDQAQQDLLGFIRMIKSDDQFTNSKVILFGCSYSATLSTWTRHDHPDEIDMIYATSGPQNAQADMNTYADKTSLVISIINSKCYDLLQEASQQLLDMFKKKRGDKKVRKLFNYCDPIEPDAKLDKMTIFEDMAAFWGNAVQTDLNSVIKNCQTLLDDKIGTSIEKYARLRTGNNKHCVRQDYHGNLVAYKNQSTDSGSLRPFFYQQCTTFGWFVTTTKNEDSPNLLFSPNEVTTEYYHNLCKDAFSNTITQQDTEDAIQEINDKYGGYYPDVTKAIFVYGGLDPWQPMGVPGNYSDDNVVYYVGSAGHCHDMFAPSPNDDEYMAPTKAGVRAQLKEWLNA